MSLLTITEVDPPKSDGTSNDVSSPCLMSNLSGIDLLTNHLLLPQTTTFIVGYDTFICSQEDVTYS